MKILRWTFLLPSALVLLSIPQLFAGMLAQLLNDVAAISVVFLFNIISGVCGLAAVKVAPNCKIGISLLLPLFMGLEGWCLATLRLSAVPLVCRLLVDVAMLIGMCAAVHDQISREASEITDVL